jgi:hypothetical protein
MFRLHTIVWFQAKIYRRADCSIPSVRSLTIDSGIASQWIAPLEGALWVRPQINRIWKVLELSSDAKFCDNHPRRIDVIGGPEYLFGRKDTIFPKNSERSKTRKGFQKYLLIFDFTFLFVRRFKCSCIWSRVHCSVTYWFLGTTIKTLFTLWRWKVAVSSETPLYIYQFARRHIPEDSSPYQYLCENLKYRSILFVWTNLKRKTRCCYEWFPGVCILCVDVSEHSVPFSWVVWTQPMKMEQSVPKRRHIKFRRRRSPRIENATFRTRRNFEIKNVARSLRKNSVKDTEDDHAGTH